jgi:hypothetical protein
MAAASDRQYGQSLQIQFFAVQASHGGPIGLYNHLHNYLHRELL